MSEKASTIKPPEGHYMAAHDLIAIAAQLTGILYRERAIVTDPEFLCDLLNRFQLSPPSTAAPMLTGFCNHASVYGEAHSALSSHGTTAGCFRRPSLHDALDEFRIALRLHGPLTVDHAAWLVEALAKLILDASA